MRRPLASLAALALFAATSWAGTLTGKFVNPMSGGIASGTLTLRLSQAAVVPGTFAVAPASVSCYTSTGGSVVGLPDPSVAPVVTPATGVGSLPAGTYYVKLTYYGSAIETLASPEAVAVLASPGELQVAVPALQPAGATGYRVYIGTSTGTETLQYSEAGWFNSAQSSALSSGAALPISNTSVCALTFNDALIPAMTYYTATLTDANGSQVAGFPEAWYLAGSSLDVSNIVPLATNPALRFPMPLLLNPSSSAAQSVASAVNLNGYALAGSANVGPGYVSFFWPGTLPAPSTEISGWTPNVAVTVRRLSAFAQTAGSGTGGETLNLVGTTSGNTCTFTVAGGGYFFGTAQYGTSNAPTGTCNFLAGENVSLNLSASSRSGTRAGNVNFVIEATAQ